MFGPIGGVELLVLVTLGLLVFGPRRLPEIGRAIGRTVADLRRAAMEVRTSIEREVSLDEVKQATHKIRRDLEETLLGEPRRLASEINAQVDAATHPAPPAAAPAPTLAPPDGPRQDVEPRS